MELLRAKDPLEKWRRRGLDPQLSDVMICFYCEHAYGFHCIQYAQSPYAQRIGRQLNQDPSDPSQTIHMLVLGKPGEEKKWSMTECRDSIIEFNR